MTWVLIIGLIMLAVALPVVARRVLFLFRLIRSGQPAPDRVANVTGRLGAAARNQVVEVLGQRRLLKWTIPGTAHAMVFWAFLILGTVYLEAFGILLSRNPEWSIPLVGHWDLLGFAQDTIALLCLVGLVLFWQIRLKNAPDKLGRQSRFKGSHLGGAYLVLFMIFNVIWTMFFFRGSSAALDNLPYGWGAYGSQAIGSLFSGIGHDALEVMEGVGLLLHIGIMLVFLIEVVHSKHLHIFLAPVNVLFKRESDGLALGAVKPLMNAGKPVTLDDIDDLDEDATLGVGTIEDFSWKGLLDFSTCTECGRCQDQCPAWNTEKPLSPKLMIMALRDHAFAKGPLVLAGEDKRAGLIEGDETLAREAERPLVGDTGDEWFYMPEDGSGVIDPDVLWSCVTCGACVNQCPVDIEHVDHIIDMRRYQVLVESNFPAELNQLFKGMENKGNPWNMSPNARMDWAKGLDFDVKVVGETIESLDEVEWLFWVGCAGAYEDRAKKTTRAVAELLDIAGVSFGVLGNGETCTGDSARRAGNEFVFQGLAQQNVETFKEFKVKKVVSTCAHCFNTLKNEYKEFGVELEVVHHTQLLNRLVREGKLTPVTEGAGAAKRSITYHDPCYIGRHNGVYSPPRELLQVLPGAEVVEMPRNSEKSFCCGAGGARMWMEETIGSRINENRTAEAVATGADQIAVGCPFCRVMLSDGLTSQQAKGEAREEVEVLDVAQMLLASVKGEVATRTTKPGDKAAAKAPAAKKSEETKAEPDPGDDTQTENTVTETADVGPAAKASGGSSLFDMGNDEPETETESEPEPTPAEPVEAPAEDETEDKPEAKTDSGLGGGSLFDLAGDEPESKPEAKEAESEPEPTPAKPVEAPAEEKAEKKAESKAAEPSAEIPEGGSLFDLEALEPAAPAAAKDPEPEPETTEPAPESKEPEPEAESEPEPTPDEPETESKPEPTPAKPVEAPAEEKAEKKAESKAAEPSAEIPEGGSLFDLEAHEPAAPAATKDPEPEPEATEPEATEPEATEPEATEPEPESEPAPTPAEPVEAPADKSEDDESSDEDDTTEEKAEPEPEPTPAEPEDSADSSVSAGAALSQAATFAAADDSDGEPEATEPEQEPEPEAKEAAPEPEAESKPEPTPAEPVEAPAEESEDDKTEDKPKPASSGEAHQPKTDVDISDSGSLFDL